MVVATRHGTVLAMDERLQAALDRVNALQRQLADALAAGDDAAAERLVAELSVVERRRNRLVHRSLDDAPAYNVTMPLRDQVIRTLTLLGRPASARLIADVSKARWGEPIPTKRLSSLRRDEQASWEANPGARAAYVTAALTGDRFAPVRGVLALSSWPLDVRILGPASPRVDLLVNLVNLARELAAGHHSDTAWVPALERLVVRLARTVPTAFRVDGIGESLDTDRIRRASQLELEVLEPTDREVRVAAAGRAANQLDVHHQLFGVRMRVVAGDNAQREPG